MSDDHREHCMDHSGCDNRITQLEVRADKHDAIMESINSNTRAILVTLIASIVLLALNLMTKGAGIVSAVAGVMP